MKVHCFFEQSGTFKNEFKKLGYEAYDYDIQNEFKETDYVIDLFSEIRGGYENKTSIFDNISQDDLIMAFFPCIRFENQIMLNFRGQNKAMKNWSWQQKMKNCMKLQNELTEMYELVNKLFIICLDRNLKLIVENPYSEEHYLRRYWCYPPSIIDRDRRDRGDYFKKPTQYWFVNCEPKFNFIFEALNYNAIECKDAIRKMGPEHYCQTKAKNQKTARSMIHPDYANRFIREYIIDTEKKNEKEDKTLS